MSSSFPTPSFGEAQFFSDVNARVLSQSKVNIRIDDGRNCLMFTSARYDVIQL